MHAIPRWGVLKFGLGMDVLLEFESGTMHTPIVKENVTHSNTNWPDFWPNFDQSYLIFKLGKVNPYLVFIKDSVLYCLRTKQRARNASRAPKAQGTSALA